MSQRKHYHIHAPYQHPQQQPQHHHHHAQQQQQQQQQHHHAQQHQQQWYTHGNLTQPQQQHYHHHGLHMRDSRHIHQQQQQQPHHNHHTMPPHMFTSGYAVGMPTAAASGIAGSGVGGSSTHSTSTAAIAQHNIPASSSLHYSTTMPSASSGGGSSSSNSSGVIVGRNRIFDLEMLNAQHSVSSSASHSMLSGGGSGNNNSNNPAIVSGRVGSAFDAYSHSSLYSQQNPRHHPHHHPPAPPPPHPIHHSHHHQQQPHHLHHQQHYYPHHHSQQQSLHIQPQQHHHQQLMPPMMQNIKSEPVEQVTLTPSIQTEEIIIKSEPMDEVTFHKNAPNPYNMEEKRKEQEQQQQQQLREQQQREKHHQLQQQKQYQQQQEQKKQQHQQEQIKQQQQQEQKQQQKIHQQHYHHQEQHHHENVLPQTQRTNSENSSTTTALPTTTEEKQQDKQKQQISLTNVKTEPKPLNFPRRKLQTERSSTLPICQRCKQVFLKRQSYTQHVALSSCTIVEYDFKCSICPMSFMSNEELQTHEQLHRMNRYFCQKYCGKFYETIEECERHEYGQHEYEMYKCNICCISLSQRDQLFNHLNEHRHQPRFDCCICRLCFQTSLELHEHYMANEDFCGKYYDKQAFKTQQITSASYLGKPESSHLEIANTFSLKDISPLKSHELQPLYGTHQQQETQSSLEPPPHTPSTHASYSNIPEFPLEPQVEVKTEIKVEPDFYPPMDHMDYSSYDNDYATPDYPVNSNQQNLAFLQDYQDNASNSTNSSFSFNNSDVINDEDAVCCVPKCGVRKISSPSLQFFSFPKLEKYLSQWLHNLKMSYDPNINYGNYRICGLHFPKRCIARYALSHWAVPTFNLGHDDVGNLYQNRESSGGFPGGEMAKCSMPGCPSQRGETNVKFHVFPRDLKTLIKWCQNSRLPVHSKENRFFCSRHFEEKCFGKFRLKPWAIPTLNLGTVYGKIHDNPNIYQEEKKCYLPYCRRSRSYDCNLSLYRFPRDETLLRRWCYNLRLDPEVYRGKNHKICSSHFIKEALGLRKLNPGAVPTLNLGHNDRFNIYENELYTPPPPPSPQPSTSSASAKARRFEEMFKQEMGNSHIYDEVFVSSMIQKFSSSSNSNSSSNPNLDLGDVCLVPSCKRTRHSDVTLHTVPKRPEQLKKWCHNLKMDLYKMHKSVRICSAHFEKYCIGGCMRPFAVPTLELGHDDSNIYRNPDVIKKLNIRETCCIQSCKRNRDRDHANLHRFPTHPELLQKWCENLQKPIPDGNKLFNDAVCEIHFEDRCLRNKRLEKWAIPTMNLGYDEAPHMLPSEEEITELWTKPFAPNNGDEQGECCVTTCKRNPQIDDVKLYRPPEDAEQMVKWAHNLQVEVIDLPNLKICNLHFEQHCIGKRLLNWAMPTLNLASKVEHLFENPPPAPTIYKKKGKPERIHSMVDGIKWSPRCSLPHCRKSRTLDRVHLFRFPYNNRQTMHKWCHNLQLPLVGSSHRRICSSHFETSVLTKRCPMTLAVPTLDLNAPPGYKIYPNPTRLKQLKVGPQRQCLIETCRKTKLDDVTLFRFPNNRNILQKWKHNIKNCPKGKLSNQFRICSQHFEPHSVGQKRLSPGAIPTLNLGHEGKDLYPNETRSFFDLKKCAVSNCDSRKDMEDIRLFKFPRDDDDLLRKWCNNLKIEPNDCVGIRVCSKHFEIECLGPRLLYKWAIPTLKLGHKEDDKIEIIPNPPPEQRAGEFLYKCCIPGCGKTRKYDDAQMNSFPKHLKLFRKWKHNLKLDFLNFKEREKYKICNDHFEPVCVGKTRLNFGALPTLNLGHDETDDLYKINPERIRPNLFIKQKDAERMERRKILRLENKEYDEVAADPEDDTNDPLGLEVSDIKCCVEDCQAPKSIMREPYDIPESKEIKQLWLKKCQVVNNDLKVDHKICGLHFQELFEQLKPQMLELSEQTADLKSDFKKLQQLYQKSQISLVICSYQCRVSGCPTNLLNSDIRLFFFPYGKNLINKWSYNTGIVPDERRYMNKVCALHFEPYCITENQRLRNWALPTLNLPPLKDDEEIYQNPDLTKIDRRMLGPQILRCAVKNCKTDKLKEDESNKLFNFPQDESILRKWCDNLKMSRQFTPLLKICSLHFEKLCFGSCRIRSWSIPTLNLGHNDEPKHFNKTSTMRQEICEDPLRANDETQLKNVKIKKSLDTTKCYISCCRKSRLQHGVRFYALPSKPKVKRKWLHNLQITNKKSGLKNIKICNLHFHKKCLDGKILKPWAVPTINVGRAENIFENPRRSHGLPIIRCALMHCKNRTSFKELRCFVFPKSPEYLEKWSKNLKLDIENCRGRICIEHFEKEVIGDKKLKNGAVPTLNLGHTDDKIYDNKELIQKLKLKGVERGEMVDKDSSKEHNEDHMEVDECGREVDDEDEFEEEYDEEEDEEEYEYEEPEDYDKASISTSMSQWSSVITKELRITLKALTPDDLYDLCSRSSYEREFGSTTPVGGSKRESRSVTPSSSIKDLRLHSIEQRLDFNDVTTETPQKSFREPRSITPEQKSRTSFYRESRSKTPDKKSLNLYRETRSQTPDQKISHHTFREPSCLTSLEQPFKEPQIVTQEEKLPHVREIFKEPTNETSNNLIKNEDSSTILEKTEESFNSSTALRTDKTLNNVSPICCLKYCGKEKTPEQHLTTFGFPKDPQLLQKWCDNLGLQPDECIGRVCIDHFELRVIGVRRLKLGAVPTLNLGLHRIAKHKNVEESSQKHSAITDTDEPANTQEQDINMLPPPPYTTPKPSKQSVFRLCCLKHCRRKKEQEMKKMMEQNISSAKLFKFPKDLKILKKWCKNLRLPEKSCLRPDLEICEKHFETLAIQGDNLHPLALPTRELSYANREPVYKNDPKDFETQLQDIKIKKPLHNQKIKTKSLNKRPKKSIKEKSQNPNKCFLKHCGNTADNDELFLVPFPLDSFTQRRWCKNLKLDFKFNEYKDWKICNQHFESYVFSRRIHLKSGGIPTLNLGHNDQILRNFRKIRLGKLPTAKKEKCCITTCQESEIKLYAFPKSGELRKIWCNNLQIEIRQALNNHFKVCGKHFTIDSFMVGTDNLKINAVPVLNLGLSNENLVVVKSVQNENENSKCLLENCQKTPSVDRIKLYGFPKKKEILKKWLFNLNLSLEKVNDQSVICSRHFDKNCTKNGVLHEKAIPTQFLEVSHKGWFYKNNEELYEEPKVQCIFSCPNSEDPNKHLYKFPKHPEELKKWLFNIKLKIEESELLKSRICSLHFEDCCKVPNKDILMPGSLPTLQLGHDNSEGIYQNNFIKCCLETCGLEGFQYHKLPEDLMLQSFWFQELQMETSYNNSLYICSVHYVSLYERVLEKYSAFLKESKEHLKLTLLYQELKVLPVMQSFKCSIPNCNSGFKLIWKLFKFPKEKSLFNKWMHNTGLNFEYSQRYNYRICAQHFEERCLSEIKLHRWSLPTLKLPFNNSLYVNPPEALPSNHENLKHCCVSNCITEKGPFFKFPAKQVDYKKWIHNLELGTQQCTLNLRVCYKHFESYCFTIEDNKIKQLKLWSVPTLRLKRKTELHLNPSDKMAFFVCCLSSCRQVLDKSKNINLLMFPRSNTLKQKWLHNLNISPLDYRENMRLCTGHFEMECFVKNSKFLRKHSVPTLGVPLPKKEQYKNPLRRPTTTTKCCVKLCEGPWENLSNFPKDKTLLRKWCHNLQVLDVNLDFLRGWKICGKHFDTKCRNQFGLLKNLAIPTIKLGHKSKKIFKNPNFAKLEMKAANEDHALEDKIETNESQTIAEEKNALETEIETKETQKVIKEKNLKQIKEKKSLNKESTLENDSMITQKAKKMKTVRSTNNKQITQETTAKEITVNAEEELTITGNELAENTKALKNVKKGRNKKVIRKLKVKRVLKKRKRKPKLIDVDESKTTNLETTKNNEEDFVKTKTENLSEKLEVTQEESSVKEKEIKKRRKRKTKLIAVDKSKTTNLETTENNDDDFVKTQTENLSEQLEVTQEESSVKEKEQEQTLTKQKLINKEDDLNVKETKKESELVIPEIKDFKQVQNISLNDTFTIEDEDYLQDYMDFIVNDESDLDILPETSETFKKITEKVTKEKSSFNTNELKENEFKEKSSFNINELKENELKEKQNENFINTKNNFETAEKSFQQKNNEESCKLSQNPKISDNSCTPLETPKAFKVKQELLEDNTSEIIQDNYHQKKPEHLVDHNYLPELYNDNSVTESEELLDAVTRNTNKIVCSVKSCTNNKADMKPDIQLFKLPIYSVLRSQWLANCQIKTKIKCTKSRVCSEHFQKHCFMQSRLLYGSIPTIFGDLPTNQLITASEESLKTFKQSRCKINDCQRSQQFDEIVKIHFPKQEDLKRKWCFNLNFEEKDILDTDWICSKHFDKKVLQAKGRTKNNAVPTLLLGHTEKSPNDLYKNPEYISHSQYTKELGDLCCVKSCLNTKINSNVQFSSFANNCKNQDIYAKWLHNLQLQDSPTIRQYYFICWDHFEPICYTKTNSLKIGSIPTLKLDKQEGLFELSIQNLEHPNSCTKNKHLYGSKKCLKCSEEKNQLFKWPNIDIFKTILLESLESTALKEQEYKECDKEIELCDEHFYVLFKSKEDYMESLYPIKDATYKKLFKLLKTDFEDLSTRRKYMDKRCSVPKCSTNHMFDKYKDIRLHNFSKHATVTKKWCYNTDIDFETIKNKPEYKICGKHFESYCFIRNHIFSWAVPTLNLPDSKPATIIQNDPDKIFAYTGHCCIKSCPNSKGLDFDTRTRFYGFPENPTMLEKWFRNIDCENFDINEIRICGLHFTPSEINKGRELREDAIPTLRLDNIISEASEKVQNIPELPIEIDENIQVKQELDNSEEWAELDYYENFHQYDLKKHEKHSKESEIYESLEIKEELIEIQEPETFTHHDKYLSENLTTTPSAKLDDSRQQSKIHENANDNLKILTRENLANSPPTTTNLKILPPQKRTLTQQYEHETFPAVKEEILEISEPESQVQDFEYYSNVPQSIKEEIIETSETEFYEPHCSHHHPPQQNFKNLYSHTHSNLVISEVKSQILLCCVQKCINSSESPDIQMYTEFPKDSEIFIKWCFNLKIDPRNYKEQQYNICSHHFESICFTDNSSLQPWSVPTLHLNLPDNSFIHRNEIPEHLKPSEQCIVYGCINPLRPLYTFPIQQDISQKWFSNLKLDYTDFRAQNYRICKRHFTAGSFENLQKLKLEAIPTLYLGHTDKLIYLNPLDEQQDQESLPVPVAAAAAVAGHDNSRGSSQGSLIRALVSPTDYEDHDSSYFEDFEEYYGQDD